MKAPFFIVKLTDTNSCANANWNAVAKRRAAITDMSIADKTLVFFILFSPPPSLRYSPPKRAQKPNLLFFA
jgi:hypothetical protein